MLKIHERGPLQVCAHRKMRVINYFMDRIPGCDFNSVSDGYEVLPRVLHKVKTSGENFHRNDMH